MSKNTSFSLGDHVPAFIEAQVSQGHHASASDVVGAALRLSEEQEAKLAAQRNALIRGEESDVSDQGVQGISAAVTEHGATIRGWSYAFSNVAGADT